MDRTKDKPDVLLSYFTLTYCVMLNKKLLVAQDRDLTIIFFFFFFLRGAQFGCDVIRKRRESSQALANEPEHGGMNHWERRKSVS